MVIIILYRIISYLKDREKCIDDRVKVGGGRLILKVEWPSEKLHPEQSENEDEEKEKEEQRHDGRQGVHEGYHKVTEWWPVPVIGIE